MNDMETLFMEKIEDFERDYIKDHYDEMKTRIMCITAYDIIDPHTDENLEWDRIISDSPYNTRLITSIPKSFFEEGYDKYKGYECIYLGGIPFLDSSDYINDGKEFERFESIFESYGTTHIRYTLTTEGSFKLDRNTKDRSDRKITSSEYERKRKEILENDRYYHQYNLKCIVVKQDYSFNMRLNFGEYNEKWFTAFRHCRRILNEKELNEFLDEYFVGDRSKFDEIFEAFKTRKNFMINVT